MPLVELVYDDGCPNVGAARSELLRAFVEAGAEPRWTEWRSGDAASPAHVRSLGSPTILVDRRDVVPPGDHCTGATCRLYVGADGALSGVPGVAVIARALREASALPSRSSGGGWKRSLAVVPGIGAALLPKVACPACWPAYAGFLTSVGLGFLLDTTYLLPLTAAFLAIAVGALAYRARSRRGYLPFAVGLLAAAVVLVGKFTFESEPSMYAGLAVLIAASVWNTWPRQQDVPACPACAAGEQPVNP